MKALTWSVIAAGFLAGAVGCKGADDHPAPSLAQRLCERGDACNYLGAGYSAEECTSDIQLCVDHLSAAARADWNAAIERCLGLQECGNFGSCYGSVPNC